jgi:hypothetical protein
MFLAGSLECNDNGKLSKITIQSTFPDLSETVEKDPLNPGLGLDSTGKANSR